MNRRTILLSIYLSLFAFVSAVAEEVPTGRCLIQNVATGKYLGAANNWGSQASLVDNPEFQTLIQLSNGKYNLESQVDFGNSAIYFNGSYMDDATPIELTIQSRSNGYFTISDGSIYYGYDGSTTVLGNTETDPAASNVQWRIITVETATAELAEATENNPKNATFLIYDPNFGRNNRYFNQWTFEASNKNNGGDVTNYCVESWHANYLMQQSITVPNGIYSLTAQGFYRLDGEDETHLPVFFINDKSVTFPKMSGTENSMSDASASFSQGLYTIDPIQVVVTDGTITLGSKLENNTTLWAIWDNFTLMYHGNETSSFVFQERFEDIVAEAQSLKAADGLTIEAQNLLEDALAAYNAIDVNTADEEQLSVKAMLENAVATAKESVRLWGELQSKYDAYHTKLANISGDNPDIASMLADVSEALAAGVLANNSDIETLLTQLVAAGKAYCEYRYWFGYDNTNLHSGILNGTSHIDVDTDMLDEGIHTLYLQLTDIDGVMSGAKAFHFQKMPKSMGEGTTCRLYVDEKLHHEELLTESSGNISWDVDCKSLAQGLHRYKAQVVSETGDVTEKSGLFMRTPTLEEMGDFRCFYMVDGNTANMKAGTSTGNSHHFDLDFSTLADGNHDLKYWFVSNTGISTHLMEASFVKAPPTGLTIIVEGNGVVEYSDSLLRDVVANYILGDSTYVKMLMQPDEGYAIRSVTMNENDTITHLLAVDETDVQHRMALELETESTSIIEIVFDLTDFTKLGDVNNDNLIDVADLAMTVLHLIGGHPQPFVERQADANNDGDLNVGDLTRIVDLITGAVERGTHNVKGQKSNEKEVQNHNTTRISGCINSNSINIDIERPTEYTAFQMILTLPEGLNATDVMLNQSYANNHQLEYGLKDDGRLAIVSYSLENSPLLLGEGTLLQILADKAIEGEIQVSDIAVVSNDGKVIKLAPMSLSGASGISQSVASSDSNNMYDLVGRKVSASKRLRGIFIIGGHKIIFR